MGAPGFPVRLGLRSGEETSGVLTGLSSNVRVLAIQSDNQVYKQAGNGVTVTVVEAIGRRLAAVHNELEAMDKG